MVWNPVLDNNKAFFAALNEAFRRTFVLIADREMTTAMRDSRFEDRSAEEKDHICREREKFLLLAKVYKQNPLGPRPGASRPHGDNDDNDNDDGDIGSSGPAGPKTWSLQTLTVREKQTMDRFPTPTRRGQGPRDDTSMAFDCVGEGQVQADVEIIDASGDEDCEDVAGKTEYLVNPDDIPDTDCDFGLVKFNPIFQTPKVSVGVAVT